MTVERRMPIEVYYGREGEAVRFRMLGISNHELRDVIVGLWLILEEPDRADMIVELEHYRQGHNRPSPPAIALGIVDGYRRGGRLA